MLEAINNFPKIGDDVQKFIKVFGTPAKESSDILYLFDVDGITPRLQCAVIDGRVYNITWSLPCGVDEVRDIALRFMPIESFLVSEGAIKLSGDVTITEDLYKISGIEEDVFFGVGDNSTFTIHIDIIKEPTV